jgi:hypothetical protein
MAPAAREEVRRVAAASSSAAKSLTASLGEHCAWFVMRRGIHDFLESSRRTQKFFSPERERGLRSSIAKLRSDNSQKQFFTVRMPQELDKIQNISRGVNQ